MVKTSYMNLSPTIKFTQEFSRTQIKFLDTTVKVNSDRELFTPLYEKPTDTHPYLHYTASHHAPSKTKGPYGQFLRLRRICTYDIDFQENAEKLFKYYIKRDYLDKALPKDCKRTAQYNQDQLLEVTTRTPIDTPKLYKLYTTPSPPPTPAPTPQFYVLPINC